jgi:hypothetical protein
MMTRSARHYPVVLAVAVILATMGLVSCSDEPTAPPADTSSYRIASSPIAMETLKSTS